MEENQPRLGSRAARRVAMRATIQARQGDTRYIVEIEDISATGARLRCARSVPVGTVLWVRLPGIEPLRAEIAWAHSFTLGCRFLAPLHSAVFENIVRSYAPRMPGSEA